MKQHSLWRFGMKAIVLPLILFIWSCITNPVTGKKELMLISEADEIAMGAQVHQGLEIEYGFYGDPELTAYIRAVGERLLPGVHRPHLKYHFHILDTPVQNAFVAPGGYIYITRGLLAMINSEAELAVVLGHELGHVNARHSARTLSRNMLFGIGLVLAGELNEDIRKATPVIEIATALLFLKYSRSDEYQADELGVTYARQARYNPGAMIDFFSSLEQLSDMSGGGGLPNFLSTHPLTPKRIEAVRTMLREDDPQLKDNEKTFLAKINGLDFGPSAQAMRVEKGLLIHPRGQYVLALADGWQAQLQSGIATLISDDQKTALVIKSSPTDQPLSALHQQHLDALNPITIIDQQSPTISGRRARLTIADKLENGTRSYGLQLISLIHERHGYGFYLLNEEEIPISRLNEVHNMIGSLRGIRSGDIPKSRKLRTRSAPVGSHSLRQILKNWAIPPQDWDTLAFLNHLPLDKQVPSGRLIKTIR